MGLEGIIDHVFTTPEFIQREWNCSRNVAARTFGTASWIKMLGVASSSVAGFIAGNWLVVFSPVCKSKGDFSVPCFFSVCGGSLAGGATGACVSAVTLTALSYAAIKGTGYCLRSRTYVPLPNQQSNA